MCGRITWENADVVHSGSTGSDAGPIRYYHGARCILLITYPLVLYLLVLVLLQTLTLILSLLPTLIPFLLLTLILFLLLTHPLDN